MGATAATLVMRQRRIEHRGTGVLAPREDVTSPLNACYYRMETLVREMQSPETGVPVRSQKLFLTTIPSAFTGYDIMEWLMSNLSIDESAEALHLASLLCQHGYIFPVGEGKTLQVRDDSSLYRFQTPYYWPSQNHVPDPTDYAIYIQKKMIRGKQKDALEEYEMEAYDQLKKTLSSKWDFIVMQAEEQLKAAKERSRGDKLVADSQERAYWRVYMPPPGFTSSLECRPVQPGRAAATGAERNSRASLTAELRHLRGCLMRARSRVSQAAECLVASYETYLEFDPLLSPVLPSNPWLTDDPTFMELGQPLVECPTEWRVRRWAISLDELVADPTGLHEITKCMQKEHSHENIRFWTAVHQLRKAALSDVESRVSAIYSEFLRPGAPCEINIDGRTMEKTQKLMKNPSRFTFDLAADHVYELLLKKDCYPRFLRSEHYGNLLTNAVNPTSKKRQLFSFGGVGKKKTLTTTSSKLSLATGTATRSDQEQTGNCAETPSAASAGIFLGVSPRAVSLPKLTLPSPSSPLLSPAGSASAPVTSPRNGASTAPGPTVAASSSPAAQQRHRQPEETGPAAKTAKKKDKTVSWTRHF